MRFETLPLKRLAKYTILLDQCREATEQVLLLAQDSSDVVVKTVVVLGGLVRQTVIMETKGSTLR